MFFGSMFRWFTAWFNTQGSFTLGKKANAKAALLRNEFLLIAVWNLVKSKKVSTFAFVRYKQTLSTRDRVPTQTKVTTIAMLRAVTITRGELCSTHTGEVVWAIKEALNVATHVDIDKRTNRPSGVCRVVDDLTDLHLSDNPLYGRRIHELTDE